MHYLQHHKIFVRPTVELHSKKNQAFGIYLSRIAPNIMMRIRFITLKMPVDFTKK